MRKWLGLSAGLLLSAGHVEAQGLVRVNIDLVAIASSQDVQEVVQRTSLFGETRTGVVSYPKLPSARGLKAGVTVGRRIGVGVNFDFVNYEQTTALAVSVPHPLFFNRIGTGVATSEVLERRDRNVDIRLIYILPTSTQWSVQLFGGPTYMSLKEDRIGGILYNQFTSLAGANTVSITSTVKETVSGSTWGFNVGADAGYFFSSHVGVGGQVSVNSGTVTLTDPFTDQDIERRAGHVTVGGGLRLRF